MKEPEGEDWFGEGRMLLLKGFESVAASLSLLTQNIDASLRVIKCLFSQCFYFGDSFCSRFLSSIFVLPNCPLYDSMNVRREGASSNKLNCHSSSLIKHLLVSKHHLIADAVNSYKVFCPFLDCSCLLPNLKSLVRVFFTTGCRQSRQTTTNRNI